MVLTVFTVTIITITILTWLLPLWAPKILNRFGIRVHPAPLWIPLFAGALYLVSEYLPDLYVNAETDTFQDHFIGGAYTALLFVYLTKLIGWRPRWWIALAALYAWTSALGVLNELYEFLLTKTNIQYIDISDTNSDLVANTLGSFVTFGILMLIDYVARQQSK